MNINHLISELIEYGTVNNLIAEDDRIYCSNRLLEFFRVEDYSPEQNEVSPPRAIHEILSDCLKYAEETGLLEGVMGMHLYYLEGTDKEYQQYFIPTYPTGVEDVFRTADRQLESEEDESVEEAEEQE